MVVVMILLQLVIMLLLVVQLQLERVLLGSGLGRRWEGFGSVVQ